MANDVPNGVVEAYDALLIKVCGKNSRYAVADIARFWSLGGAGKRGREYRFYNPEFDFCVVELNFLIDNKPKALIKDFLKNKFKPVLRYVLGEDRVNKLLPEETPQIGEKRPYTALAGNDLKYTLESRKAIKLKAQLTASVPLEEHKAQLAERDKTIKRLMEALTSECEAHRRTIKEKDMIAKTLEQTKQNAINPWPLDNNLFLDNQIEELFLEPPEDVVAVTVNNGPIFEPDQSITEEPFPSLFNELQLSPAEPSEPLFLTDMPSAAPPSLKTNVETIATADETFEVAYANFYNAVFGTFQPDQILSLWSSSKTIAPYLRGKLNEHPISETASSDIFWKLMDNCKKLHPIIFDMLYNNKYVTHFVFSKGKAKPRVKNASHSHDFNVVFLNVLATLKHENIAIPDLQKTLNLIKISTLGKMIACDINTQGYTPEALLLKNTIKSAVDLTSLRPGLHYTAPRIGRPPKCNTEKGENLKGVKSQIH